MDLFRLPFLGLQSSSAPSAGSIKVAPRAAQASELAHGLLRSTLQGQGIDLAE